MVYGIGNDIIEVVRIKEAIEQYGERFLKRIFTQTEQEYCESFKENKYLHYAARFAAKESFSKAIGTGITKGFKFKDVSIKNEENGQPIVVLTGELAEKWSEYKIFVSLSHTEGNATAFVVMER